MVYVIQDMLTACEQDQDGTGPDPARKLKLVHLVGFIIRIYHNARSPKRQIRQC